MADRILQDERVNFKKHESLHWLRLQATDDDCVEDIRSTVGTTSVLVIWGKQSFHKGISTYRNYGSISTETKQD